MGGLTSKIGGLFPSPYWFNLNFRLPWQCMVFLERLWLSLKDWFDLEDWWGVLWFPSKRGTGSPAENEMARPRVPESVRGVGPVQDFRTFEWIRKSFTLSSRVGRPCVEPHFFGMVGGWVLCGDWGWAECEFHFWLENSEKTPSQQKN